MRALIAVLVLGIFSACGAHAASRFEPSHQLGFSIGTPAGLNAEYMREFGEGAFFLSGAYFGSLYGAEAGVSVFRTGTMRKHMAIYLVAGHSFLRERNTRAKKRWTYGGVEVLLRRRRLFFAPGISVGGGSYSNPQLMARIGFTWPL